MSYARLPSSDLLLNHPSEGATLPADVSDAQTLTFALIERYLSQTNDQGMRRFSPQTVANYSRDLRRFLIFLDGRPLSSVTLEDVQDFIQWLKEPPADLIHPTTRLPSDHPDWKPFYRSGLSPVALKQQMASVKAFYRWLNECGYLNKNPFNLVKSSKKRPVKTERHIHTDDIKMIQQLLIALTPPDEELRVREMELCKSDQIWVRYRWVWMAYLTSGFRLSELITSDPFRIQQTRTKKNLVWQVYVKGKGRDEFEYRPVHERFINEYQRYRHCLGLTMMPLEPGGGFFYSLTGRNVIESRSSIHNIFKEMIAAVADLIEGDGEIETASRIRLASVHWMRHSFATFLLDTTHDIPLASKVTGHRNIQTLMQYDHAEKDEIHDLLSDLSTHWAL
jgi:site-specific recombinase XerD